MSFIAGLLVEKYRYHLPLYRQHQRLEASGVTVSRGTLTNLEQRAGQLLQPVAHEVLDSWEPEATKEALKQIGALYKVEDDIRRQGLEGNTLRDYRQQKAKPLVDQFFEWNREQLQRLDLVPGNPLSKALGYVHKREKELQVYLNDPTVAIDTHHLERGLRCIPMGRKNWMFCWTKEGADRCLSTNVAVFQTLITSCLLAGIDPCKYLVDVLQRISLHPARDIRELIPRLWKEKFGANPLKVDLDK